jgi:hypothetical protein
VKMHVRQNDNYIYTHTQNKSTHNSVTFLQNYKNCEKSVIKIKFIFYKKKINLKIIRICTKEKV